eukprot:6720455-Pyramimonas_sp.AAC.1
MSVSRKSSRSAIIGASSFSHVLDHLDLDVHLKGCTAAYATPAVLPKNNTLAMIQPAGSCFRATTSPIQATSYSLKRAFDAAKCSKAPNVESKYSFKLLVGAFGSTRPVDKSSQRAFLRLCMLSEMTSLMTPLVSFM